MRSSITQESVTWTTTKALPFSIKSFLSTRLPVVNIPLTCSARSPLHRTAASQAVGMPTETPATPLTLWPQATPSPVSEREGVNPSGCREQAGSCEPMASP